MLVALILVGLVTGVALVVVPRGSSPQVTTPSQGRSVEAGAGLGRLYRLTLRGSVSGLTASPSAGPAGLCLRPTRGVCRDVEGFEDAMLSDPMMPRRFALVETINGLVLWRHYVAAVGPGITMQRLHVRGHLGFFVPASGQTGDQVFLEWDEPPGVSVILSAPGLLFTRADLESLANALVVESVTVEVVNAAAPVLGVPPPGEFTNKTHGYVPAIKGYKPGANMYLTYLSPPSGPCLGLGLNSECVPILHTNTIGYLPKPGAGWPVGIIAGLVPRGTHEVVIRLSDNHTIRFSPATTGPSPRQRYFAHWLPKPTSVATKITARNNHGHTIATAAVVASRAS